MAYTVAGQRYGAMSGSAVTNRATARTVLGKLASGSRSVIVTLGGDGLAAVEQRLESAESWEHKPKPQVAAQPPVLNIPPAASQPAPPPLPPVVIPPLTAEQELVLLARTLWHEGYDDHLAGHITYKLEDGTLLNIYGQLDATGTWNRPLHVFSERGPAAMTPFRG